MFLPSYLAEVLDQIILAYEGINTLDFTELPIYWKEVAQIFLEGVNEKPETEDKEETQTFSLGPNKTRTIKRRKLI